MKKLFFLASFCFSVLSFSQTAKKDSTEKKPIIYIDTELTTLPSYKGGNEKLGEYLSLKLKNIKTPEKYIKASCKFMIVIEFIVETNGKITNVVIPKEYSDEMESKDIEQIKEVFLQMPYWNLGTLLNEPKRALMALPLTLN